MKTDISIGYSLKRVSDLLCSALEGGSNYWYLIEKFIKPPVIKKYADSAVVYDHLDYAAPGPRHQARAPGGPQGVGAGYAGLQKRGVLRNGWLHGQGGAAVRKRALRQVLSQNVLWKLKSYLTPCYFLW